MSGSNSEAVLTRNGAADDGSLAAASLLAAAVVVYVLSQPLGDLLFISYLLLIGVTSSWRASLESGRFRIVALLVLVVASWMAVAAPPDPGWGLHTYSRLARRFPVTLVDFIPFLGAFLVVAGTRRSTREVRWFLGAIVATLPFHFVLAAGERLRGWDSRPVYEYGGIVWFEMTVAGTPHGGARGGFYNHNALGFFGVVCLTAALALWLDHRRRSSRVLGPAVDASARAGLNPAQATAHIGFALLVAGSLLLVLWSASRTALAAALLSCWLLLRFAGVSLRHVYPPLLAALFVVALAIGGFGPASTVARALLPQAMTTRLAQLHDGSQLVWRYRVFECGLSLVYEKPMTGWGVGRLAPECEERLGIAANHAHNLLIQVFAESGLPIGVAFVAVIGLVLWQSGRVLLTPKIHARSPPHLGLWTIVASIIVMSLPSLVLLHMNRWNMLFWWSLGALASRCWRAVPAGAIAGDGSAIEAREISS